MGKIVIVIIAVIASIMLADSLTCNKCSYGLAGFCLSNSEINCTSNTSVCFTAKTSFPAFTLVGFNTQGCQEPAGCNATANGTIAGATYETKVDCCSANKCNPVQVSAAPSTKMTLTAAIGAAILASMLGSIQ